MILKRPQILLAGFFALVAWGFVVRHLPIVKHVFNAFLVGFIAALLSVFFLTLMTSRHIDTFPTPRPITPAFLSPAIWRKDRARFKANLEYDALNLHPTSPAVSDALGQLLELVLRTFVSSWYKMISTSPKFSNEVDRNIRMSLIELRDRILAQDVVDVLVAHITPLVTSHLLEFDSAEKAVRGKASNRNVPESEELDLAVARKYKGGNLHPACSLSYSDTKSIQQDYFRKLMVRVLPDVMDESMVKSRAVAVLSREIVSCAVLYPAFQMIADPDTWNQVVEAYGKSTLQDRKTVKRMRAALDEHTSIVNSRMVPSEIPRLQAHDSERVFEKFVRAIRKTKTLADARRFRSQITSQLARERLVDGQDQTYIRRLEMGKRVLDQKIAKMTSSEPSSIHDTSQLEKRVGEAMPAYNWSLVEIMHTASGLSYFMEYMDRQSKMSLVQFWINVDGFRNPLEDDFGDENSTANMAWSDTDRLDIAQIAETYIMKKELHVPKEWQNDVQDFLVAGRKATPEQYRAARTAILSSQSAVLEELEQKYLPNFRKSDLYYKFLASDEGIPRQRQSSITFDGNSNGGNRPKPFTPQPRTLTPPITRTNSQLHHIKTRDLRRAALSSSDVRNLSSLKAAEGPGSARRSLDVDRPLFDVDLDYDPLSWSIQSLGTDSVNGDANPESDMIRSMGAALTDIMTESPSVAFSDVEPEALFMSATPSFERNHSTPIPHEFKESLFGASEQNNAAGEKHKPSLAALGLVNTSSRIGVFQDNDLFGDEEKFAEDEYADSDEPRKKLPEEEIHQAAPGDLGLVEAIGVLSDEIEKLVSQEAVVDTLTRKAELTNNAAELRILGKSKASIEREIRRKELQRQQYIIQESDNSLYGRASVGIKSVMVGREEDGSEYAVYVIEVERRAGDEMPAASWIVAHRYSEFHDLHSKLRKRYPSTRNLEFPRRRVVMKLQKQFLHNRRVALEAYLQELLRISDVCRSRELRSFLSQQAFSSRPNKDGNKSTGPDTQDIVARIYNSVTDGMDEFLGNVAALNSLSAAGQNLISAATMQMTSSSTSNVNNRSADDMIIQPNSIAEAEAELRAFEDKELEPFVKPICDIFLEIFELNRSNNWLRGRAVVVVLHQLLGGTVERKVRDSFATVFAEDSLLRYVETIKNTMFPLVADLVDTEQDQSTKPEDPEARIMRPAGPVRTKVQKEASRHEAAAVLNTLVPELVGSVVGRANATAASRRTIAAMNNKRLNEHLVLTIFDELVAVLFDGNPSRVRLKGKGKKT